jgi:hypothetical protein
MSRLGARAARSLAGPHLRPDPGCDADARQPEYRANVPVGESEPGGILPILARTPTSRGETEVKSAIQEIGLEHRRRCGYRRGAAELKRRGMLVNYKLVVS